MDSLPTLRIATAQFETSSGDKDQNFAVMESLIAEAASGSVQAIAFHECCISGYRFASGLSEPQMLELAERLPQGPSVQRLKQLAGKYRITILAGLFEKDEKENLYNTYIAVDSGGMIARHRKLHPFISPFLKAGDQYTLFSIGGWKCGILTCYDNNVVENVRATVLLGAQILFMPHVTMCTPSARPGSGFVDPQRWENRNEDPHALRQEFDGAKGRAWLMNWLPSRAQDNGIFVVFSNAIGWEGDQIKNGCSMVLNPFGQILAECRRLGNDWCFADLDPGQLQQAGGYRYLQARRPDLYAHILGAAHDPHLQVSWMKDPKK